MKTLCLKTLAVAAAMTAAVTASAADNILGLSLGDLYSTRTGDARCDTPERVENAVTQWSKMIGATALLWRVDTTHIDYYEMEKTGYIAWMRKTVEERRKKFDYDKCGRDIAHKLGMKFILNLSFNDGGWPREVEGYKVFYCWQDKTLIAHPEYQEVDREGKYHYGYLDLSNPAARKYIIDRMVKYVNDLKADGLYLNSRSHSGLYSSHATSKYKPGPHHADRFGFGKELVKEYKKRYGIDILTDPRFDYKSPKFAPQSVEVENWRKLRGEYFLTFYREVRQALGKDQTLILTLPLGNYMGSSGGNIYVDHEQIIKEKLGDALVLDVSSGFVPIGLQKKLGYLSSREAKINVPTVAQYMQRYGKLAASKGIKLYTFQHDSYQRGFQKEIDKIPYYTGKMFQHLPLQSHPEYADVPGLRPTKGIFSVEVVTKPTVFGGSGRPVSKYSHYGTPCPRGWEIFFTPDRKTKKWNVHFRAFLRIPVGNRPPAQHGERDVILKSSVQIPLNEWSHVGGTIDMNQNKMFVYVNGKMTGSVDIPKGSYPHQNTNVALKTGVYGGDATHAYRGLLESIRISDRPIPATGKIPAYTGKEPGTTFFVNFNNSVEPAVNKIGTNVSYDMTPVFKDGRNGQKAIWFNDQAN